VLDAYFAQDWAKAAELNDGNEATAAHFGLTRLVMLYRERIIAFTTTPPPAGWDGVYDATSK
jgi:hypothetical protein